MAQFANCTEHNKWNDAQKLAYLCNSLEKEEAYVLWDYGKDAIGSLSGLMQILETRLWPTSTELNSEIGDVELVKRYRAYTATLDD